MRKKVTKTENFIKIEEDKKEIKLPLFNNGFTPSKYQSQIFDYIKHENGNLVIEACSGSGKTTTLINCISLLPQDKKILFVAFNKDIVTDIQKKTKDMNVEVKTVHSLGRLIICDYLETNRIALQSYKYISYIRANLYKFVKNTQLLKRKQFYNKYVNNLISLIDIARLNLCNNSKDIEDVAAKYNIKIIHNEIEVILKIMFWGSQNIEEIDYVDMIWLPCVLPVSYNNFKYDYIFVDECQDLNKVQQKLILNCFKLGTRGFFCGDENQSIYSFMGADKDAMDEIRKLPNTVSLPLSISYRCPKNVIKLANEYVKEIEPAENAKDGQVLYKCNLEDVKDGDAILCRNNAPLLKIYTELINQGKKANIMGKDIGENLIKIINSIGIEQLNLDLNEDGVFVRLYKDLFELKKFMMKEYRITEKDVINSAEFANKYDIIRALEIISNDIQTSTELVEKINKIFSDDKVEGIVLSSCHKSKGREFENVYIACHKLMPSKMAVTEWEKKQEKNLIYVAYTRTKNILGFLDDEKYSEFLEEDKVVVNNLQLIEEKINKIKTNTNLKNYEREKPIKIQSTKNKVNKPITTTTTKKKKPNQILKLFN